MSVWEARSPQREAGGGGGGGGNSLHYTML